MLHTYTETGHLGWRCPCGRENTAHHSHDEIAHPSMEEFAPVIEGTQTDEQGVTHLRNTQIKTGKRIVHPDMIALPACDCGKQTFLKVLFSDEEFTHIARHTEDGTPTNASVEAAHRHIKLAQHLQAMGKGVK